jgi:uncharacterized protein
LAIQYELMSTGQRVKERRDEILRLAACHGAGNVRLFGSVARGEDTPESDVDLLVDVTGETSPWFPGGLVADLEQLLGRRVQVVIRRSLSPLIRDSVLREAVPL